MRKLILLISIVNLYIISANEYEYEYEEEEEEKKENEENEYEEKEKEIEKIINSELNNKKCPDYIIKISETVSLIVILLSSLAFLVLSILSFDNKYKIYFILAFLLQGFYFIVMIIIFILMTVDCGSNDKYDNGHHLFSSGLILLSCGAILGCCIYLGLEIATLVFFIKFFSKLRLLAKIGYFAHLLYFLECLMTSF